MDTITYDTGETRVLSASTAARVRAAWPQFEVRPAPRQFKLVGEKCVQLMSVDGHAGSQDLGFAINTFPTRSGPPL